MGFFCFSVVLLCYKPKSRGKEELRTGTFQREPSITSAVTPNSEAEDRGPTGSPDRERIRTYKAENWDLQSRLLGSAELMDRFSFHSIGRIGHSFSARDTLSPNHCFS